MRFGLYLTLIFCFSGASYAAPGDLVKLNDAGAKASSQRLGKQLRTSNSKLRTLDTLQLTEAARGLGQISAIGLAQDGTLFAAEEKRGRIWQLTDRNQDGIFEHRRPLPQRFDHPSAITVIDETLYVADRAALWALSPLAPTQQLASLKNSQSRDQRYFLTSQEGQLVLGFNTVQGQAKVMRIDITTGQAELISSATGAITAIAGRKHLTLRLAMGSKLGAPNTAHMNETGLGTTLTGLLLPPFSSTVKSWPSRLDNHILAAQAGPGAMHILAIPTEFGEPADQAFVLVDGFMTRSGRNAWGQPGALAMDKRGLFFMDSWNGSLWHLSGRAIHEEKASTPTKTANTQSKKAIPTEASSEHKPLLKGSGIGSASTIDSASNLTVGSLLKKDYEDKKKKEADEKAAQQERKRRIANSD